MIYHSKKTNFVSIMHWNLSLYPGLFWCKYFDASVWLKSPRVETSQLSNLLEQSKSSKSLNWKSCIYIYRRKSTTIDLKSKGGLAGPSQKSFRQKFVLTVEKERNRVVNSFFSCSFQEHTDYIQENRDSMKDFVNFRSAWLCIKMT